MVADQTPALEDEPDTDLLVIERGPPWDRLAKLTKIAIRQFQGHPFVDLRELYRAKNNAYAATRRGVTLRVRDLDAVIDALTKAREALVPK